jgi:hypothetical protein
MTVSDGTLSSQNALAVRAPLVALLPEFTVNCQLASLATTRTVAACLQTAIPENNTL